MLGNIYSDLALKEIPRLFSLLDRNRYSPTFGCFDRKYWRYKIVDYTNARLQEACYTLALLYKNKYPQNKWYKNEKIKEYAIAAMNFWSKQQNSDGSFDEYLPNEHSHVATAFSTYAVANAYIILNLKDENILNSLEKAARWLHKNDDLIVVNHDASTVPALYLIYKISGKEEYLKYCEKKLEKILKNQNPEGWLSEYGSADIGYQSFSIYYLSKYYKLRRDNNVLGPLSKAVNFFSYFVHPDYSIGGHYGSRETSYVIPTGFEILSEELPIARSISNAIKKALSLKKIIGPYSFDDRFLADNLYPYLEAATLLKSTGKDDGEKLPKDNKEFTKYFENCGLYVRKTPELYLIFNTKKGGVGKVFNKNTLIYNDTGWIAKKDKKIITTNGPSEGIVDKNQLTVDGNFYYVGVKYQTPLTTVILRFLNFIRLHNTLKSLLRKKLIPGLNNAPIRFKRKIKIKDDCIIIKDFFDAKSELGKLCLSNNFSCIYSTILGLYEEEFRENEILVGQTEEEIKILITPTGASLMFE